MDLYRQLYEFAASAGALEGYVYRRKEMDMKALPIWVDNLKTACGLLPPEVLGAVQPSIDQTLGRAWQSLGIALGKDHELAAALRSMIRGPLPGSPDDFQKQKHFQK